MSDRYSTPDFANNPSDLAGKVAAGYNDAKATVKETAYDIENAAGKSMDAGRASTATTLSNAAAMIDERAANLPGGKKIEDFARGAADKIATSAQYVRNHDTKAMMADVEAFVRSHPGRSLMVACVVGFFAGRAFKVRD